MDVSGQFDATPALSQRQQPLVPIEQDLCGPPEPVWTIWRSEKLPVHTSNQTTIPQVFMVCTTPKIPVTYFL